MPDVRVAPTMRMRLHDGLDRELSPDNARTFFVRVMQRQTAGVSGSIMQVSGCRQQSLTVRVCVVEDVVHVYRWE